MEPIAKRQRCLDYSLNDSQIAMPLRPFSEIPSSVFFANSISCDLQELPLPLVLQIYQTALTTNPDSAAQAEKILFARLSRSTAEQILEGTRQIQAAYHLRQQAIRVLFIHESQSLQTWAQELRTLDLAYREITPYQLSALMRIFPNLRQITLSTDKLAPSDLICLNGIAEIFLCSHNCNAFIPFLRWLPSLKMITIQNDIPESLNAYALKILSKLPQLQGLCLHRLTETSESFCRILPRFLSLKTLQLVDTPITHNLFRYASLMPSLQLLDLRGCCNIPQCSPVHYEVLRPA